MLRSFAGSTETGIRFVGQAVVQGMRANLELFLQKCEGMDLLHDPRAPRIYERGREVDLQEALRRLSREASAKAHTRRSPQPGEARDWGRLRKIER